MVMGWRKLKKELRNYVLRHHLQKACFYDIGKK
jgi:hypothetical protein